MFKRNLFLFVFPHLPHSTHPLFLKPVKPVLIQLLQEVGPQGATYREASSLCEEALPEVKSCIYF
jgi:hypothetical protein